MKGIPPNLVVALAGEGYQVVSQLGQGGLGVVYQAIEVELGRDVAIKLLHAANPGEKQLERFQREARIAAQLDHPGIVRVHRVGQVLGRPYLVYQLVPGARTLTEAWRRLDWSGRRELLTQVADAVGHAHEQGVVHRDLKPDNVLVDPDERALVTDFGLAFWQQSAEQRLTQTGQWVGTPHYMAPEQFSGAEPAPTADVWALGVMLYQALTDELPFEGRSLPELSSKIFAAEPRRPSSIQSEVSRGGEQVCLRCLRAEPEQRYADAGQLADALLATERRGIGILPLAVAALVLALGGISAGFVLGTAKSPTPRPGSGPLAGSGSAPASSPAEPALDPAAELAALVADGRFAEAVERGQALDRPSPEVRRAIGVAWLLQGDVAQARQALPPRDQPLADLGQDTLSLSRSMEKRYRDGEGMYGELDGPGIRRSVAALLDVAERTQEKWSGALIEPLLAQAQDAVSSALALHISVLNRQSLPEARALCQRNAELLERGDSAARARVSLALSYLILGTWDEIGRIVRMNLFERHPDEWSQSLKPELRFFAYGVWVLDHPEDAAAAELAIALMDDRISHRKNDPVTFVHQAMLRVRLIHEVGRAYRARRDGDPQADALAAGACRLGRSAWEDRWNPVYHQHNAVLWASAEILAGDLEGAREAMKQAGARHYRARIAAEIQLAEGDLSAARRSLSLVGGKAPMELTAIAHLAALDGQQDVAERKLAASFRARTPAAERHLIPWREPEETRRILAEGSWYPGRP